jgi:hypothetical protein
LIPASSQNTVPSSGANVLKREWRRQRGKTGPLNPAGAPPDKQGRASRNAEDGMTRLFLAVVALILAALAAGAYFQFNPAIAIFVILGFGIYGVIRIGGPGLPKGACIPWRASGVDIHGRDYVQDDDPLRGEDQREGDGFR